MRAFFILCLLACEAGAATWYVRPSVSTTFSGSSPNGPVPTAGVYGSQNGTSYANAWNGLNSIVFGGAGVLPGDSIYVCGSHIYTLSNINNFPTQARVPVTVSGFTIRMDYPSDPGLIFGGAINQEPAANVWLGPDANGVYWSTNTVNGNHYPTPFQVVGTNITRLNTQLAETWAGNPGGWYYTNNTNFVKTTDNSNPAGKIAFQTFGWTFDLGKQSNIVFLNCTFHAANRLTGGGVVWDLPNYTGFIGANHINWTNCALLQGSAVALFPGNDFWTFDGCEIGNATYGIYGFYDSQTRGPDAIRINNCYIHDIDTTNYPDEGGDGHGIGARDTSNWVVTSNRLERTASAIDFFVDAGWYRTNNLIEHNFVKDVRLTHPIGTEGTGGGILFEGGTIAGRSISNRINGNILLNIGVGAIHDWQGEGIGSGGIDYIQILNNTIVTCHSGITISSSTPLNAKVENNIIANIEFRYIDFVGTGAATNLTLDYNLYYPIISFSTQFRLFPSETHDTHSVFANPSFSAASPVAATNFQLKAGSAAMNVGTLVGLTLDFASGPIPTTRAPDIGAYQGRTNTAASCSFTDIQAAVDRSYPGYTVLVPAGTCDPVFTVTITNAINLLAMSPGVTLSDSITNSGDGSSSAIFSLNVPASPDVAASVAGFTFIPGSRAATLFEAGNIRVAGSSTKIRLYNNVFNASKNIGVGWYDCFGVYDHNIWTNHQFVQPMKIHHGSYGTPGGFGDGAWALPPWTNSLFEDASAVYIEDNVFTNLSGVAGLGIDADSGARYVFRHNIGDRIIVGGHGLETTGRSRGSRVKDVYANLFVGHGDSEAGHWRSGSGILASNTLVNVAGTAGFNIRNYRLAFGGFWKYANGTNIWDVNDPTIYGTGIATAGGTLALTDSTAAWTPHAFIARSVRNVGTGRSSIVIDNTATTLTFISSTDSPGSDLSFSPGDTYQIRRIITVMDEAGRGQGLLVSNSTPVIAGIAQSPQQVVEPIWNWGNTLNGGALVMNNGGYYSSVVGQEIRNEFNPNFRAFQYPHPLVTGTNSPPTPPGPVAPTIVQQPQSTNVYATQTATFTVSVTGTTPLAYQWKTNGVNAGITPDLTIGPCPVIWSGMSVVCVVTNVAGTATSSTATLTVSPDPVIGTQPHNATTGVGLTAAFTVTATGQSTLSYQWKRNGSTIAAATLSAYTTPVTTSANNGDAYAVVVTCTAGSLQSANATLTVTNITPVPDPVITAQPHSTNIYVSQFALFSLTASGGSTLTYQWKTNGVNAGTNGPAYSLGPCPIAWDGIAVLCVISDLAGSVTSSIATLGVLPDPVITSQPANATASVGGTATFSVTATGQTALTYQWYRNGSSISGKTQSAMTTPTLTFSGNNGDAYFVDVTDSAGTLRSASATLTVYPSSIARVTLLRVNVTKVGP